MNEPESLYIDRAGNAAADQEAAREDALEEIVNRLISGEDIRFSKDNKWTLGELLGNYLKLPNNLLDDYIAEQEELNF